MNEAGHDDGPGACKARVIAFYLPQFHAVPENDEWWGPGFTEWTNVRKARPLFPGHQQPRRPGELGYYDLTDPAARSAQAALARTHGIEGFCYWHYWFGNGRRLLEKPFDAVLSSGEPDFPFCLCWANQSWTGVWHGAPGKLLMEQTYPGPDDEQAHFDAILPAFLDSRYLRIDGRPIFLVYAPGDLPDAGEFVRRWRLMAQRAGLPGLWLIGMGRGNSSVLEPFDQILPYGPGDFLDQQPAASLPGRALRRFAAGPAAGILGSRLRLRLGAPRRYRYQDVVAQAFTRLPHDDTYLPCVIPGWDNTPRSGRRGVVIEGATAALFHDYVLKALARLAHRPPAQRLLFVKAWNEWAEGNFLEPDADTGDGFLRALHDAVRPAD